MQRRSHPPYVFVLLVLVPVLIVVGVCFYLGKRSRQLAPATEVSFRTTTGPPLRFVSSFTPSAPPSQSAGGATGSTSTAQEEDTIVSLNPLADGRIMLARYPECVYFDIYGNEIGRLKLETPDAEFFESEGLDPKECLDLMRPENVDATTATESGAVWVAFRVSTDFGPYDIACAHFKDPAVLKGWDSSGNPTCVEDLDDLFSKYAYLEHGMDYFSRFWLLDARNDEITIASAPGAFAQLGPDRELQRIAVAELIEPQGFYSFYIHGNSLFTSAISRPLRQGLDGSIDWDWLQATSHLFQPQQQYESDTEPHRGTHDLLLLMPDSRTAILTARGITEVAENGQAIRVLGDAKASAAISENLSSAYGSDYTCARTTDGWLLIPRWRIHTEFGDDVTVLRTDNDFNPIKTVEFRISEPPQAAPPASTSAQAPDAGELPILDVGDTADPRFIRRDFQPIPGGYRAIDHTRRRVLTMDSNLQVTAVLDRSDTIPNGLWQDIDVCRVDSRGVTYLLDREKGLVQVLDENGNYLRKHRDLGVDLFGSPLGPKDLAIDSLDRLWIIGERRIFILDRNGNLAQIFESRGAPYIRPAQSGGPVIAPEHTPLGYTILPSADPLVGRRDPSEPTTLDVSGFSQVTVASAPNAPRLFYVQQQAAADQVVIFDWSGRERGSIDLTGAVRSNNRGFLVGPDGYCYLVDPEHSYIIVLDSRGQELCTIQVEGLPEEGWGPALGASFATPGTPSRVRGFIDENGRLLVYDTQEPQLMLFPLREGDKLGEGLEDLD